MALPPGLRGWYEAGQADADIDAKRLSGLAQIQQMAQAQYKMGLENEFRTKIAAAKTPEERYAVAAQFMGPDALGRSIQDAETKRNAQDQAKGLRLLALQQQATRDTAQIQARINATADAREKFHWQQQLDIYNAGIKRQHAAIEAGNYTDVTGLTVEPFIGQIPTPGAAPTAPPAAPATPPGASSGLAQLPPNYATLPPASVLPPDAGSVRGATPPGPAMSEIQPWSPPPGAYPRPLTPGTTLAGGSPGEPPAGPAPAGPAAPPTAFPSMRGNPIPPVSPLYRDEGTGSYAPPGGVPAVAAAPVAATGGDQPVQSAKAVQPLPQMPEMPRFTGTASQIRKSQDDWRDQWIKSVFKGNAGAPGDFSKTGEEYLASIPEQDRGWIRKIGAYEIDPTSLSNKEGYRERVLKMTSQAFPDYDQKNYKTISNALKQFGPGGLEGRTVRAQNVVIHHMATAADAATALGNDQIQVFNLLANELSKQLGKPAPTNFEAMRDIVADEVVKAILGGPGALADREAAAAKLKTSSSPEQFVGTLNQWMKLMGGQLAGLEQQYKQSTRRNDFRDRLNPRSIKAMDEANDSLLPSFATEAEARAAGHKNGDRVKINGAKGTLR